MSEMCETLDVVTPAAIAAAAIRAMKGATHE